MTKLPKAIMAAAAGVALLGVAAGPVLAHGAAEPGGRTPHMQPAHMGQGYGGGSAGPSYGAAPCPGMRAGMGPGMMMDPGMMGGHGMMDHGMMGRGKSAIQADKDLSADDVRGRLERSLKWHGNERLKVGEVKELDDDTIVAEIVTLDDSLVDRFKVDRHTGSMLRTE